MTKGATEGHPNGPKCWGNWCINRVTKRRSDGMWLTYCSPECLRRSKDGRARATYLHAHPES